MKILDKLFRRKKGSINIVTAPTKKLWSELDDSTKGLILFHVAGYTMCGFMLLGGKLFGDQVGGFVGMIIFWVMWLAILVIRDFRAKN